MRTDREEQGASVTGWSGRVRAVVSVFLGLHVLAVFVAPWSNPPPSSLLSQRLAGGFDPYLHAAFLNHGYRFFAPNPGPSHLVRYEILRADGTKVQGRFPDPQRHWPRLLYHRHFMISETVFNLQNQIVQMQAQLEEGTRLGMPPLQQQQLNTQLQQTRQLADSLYRGLARQLLQREQGERVTLVLQEHSIPFEQDVLGGMALSDPQLYVDLATLGQYTGDDL